MVKPAKVNCDADTTAETATDNKWYLFEWKHSIYIIITQQQKICNNRVIHAEASWTILIIIIMNINQTRPCVVAM